MNSQGYNSFHFQRHLAATHVRPEHYTDFQRLVKTIRHGSHYQLLVAEFNDVSYRNKLIEHVDHVATEANLHSVRFDLLSGAYTTFADVEAKLQHLTTLHEVIHILGGEQWFGKDKRWDAFNIRREAIAQTLTSRIVMWLTTDSIRHMALHAPDLWAWRSGVFSFSISRESTFSVSELPPAQSFDSRSLPQRTKRIAELRTLLHSDVNIPDDLRLPLLDELASLLGSIGELDEALRIRLDLELPVYEHLGNTREIAITQGKIADILEIRGELDAALIIRLEEQLPAYERLGDERSRAITQGKIAFIRRARGDLNEALRLLKDEVLITFERLGDSRSKAVTLGKIADILQAQGHLDEALRICVEELLPVFERLGDVREKAITQGQIADILLAQGRLDEALRIRAENQLPVYRRLGDVREEALTQGKIADIRLARGELDEALRIRTELELPVYTRLNAERERALTLLRIAEIRLQRGDHLAGGIQQIVDGLTEALTVAQKLGDPQGIDSIGSLLAQVLALSGQKNLPTQN